MIEESQIKIKILKVRIKNKMVTKSIKPKSFTRLFRNIKIGVRKKKMIPDI